MLNGLAGGNPGWVSRSITWDGLIHSHQPVLTNALFAGVQFLIAFGIVSRGGPARRLSGCPSSGPSVCGGSGEAAGRAPPRRGDPCSRGARVASRLDGVLVLLLGPSPGLRQAVRRGPDRRCPGGQGHLGGGLGPARRSGPGGLVAAPPGHCTIWSPGWTTVNPAGWPTSTACECDLLPPSRDDGRCPPGRRVRAAAAVGGFSGSRSPSSTYRPRHRHVRRDLGGRALRRRHPGRWCHRPQLRRTGHRAGAHSTGP